MDEKAASKEWKEYHKAIKKYKLDKIKNDAWGHKRIRYMYDAFFVGFMQVEIMNGINMKVKCPLCNSDYMKVIYYGLPHKFCINDKCNCMFGFFERFTSFLSFNGFLFVYENISYWRALLRW